MTDEEFSSRFSEALMAADIFVIPLYAGAWKCEFLRKLVSYPEQWDVGTLFYYNTACVYARCHVSHGTVFTIRDEKWFVYLQMEKVLPGTVNTLYLGNNHVSFEFCARHRTLPAYMNRVLQEEIFFGKIHEHPDDWSGSVFVWDGYDPSLIIKPTNWHLDISYAVT